MTAELRREAVLEALRSAARPVRATALAERFGVSRQIIVGDVALLRAGGTRIAATPRGYIMEPEDRGTLRQVACRHTAQEMEEETAAIAQKGEDAQ